MLHDVGDISKSKIINFQDAYFANLPGKGSWGGYIILIQGENSNIAQITWQSQKIRRIVRCRITANTLVLLDSFEESFCIKAMMKNILRINNDQLLPIVCFRDNNFWYNSIYTTKTVTDKCLFIDVSIIRKMPDHNLNGLKYLELNGLKPILKRQTVLQNMVLLVWVY